MVCTSASTLQSCSPINILNNGFALKNIISEACFCLSCSEAIVINRPPDKGAYLKIIFLIS